MVEITWTAEAERWLRDIHAHIAADNPTAALRVIESIYQRVQTLRKFPELGYRYVRITNRHIRILVYGHYRIAYLLRPSGNIEILGAFHGALQIERLL